MKEILVLASYDEIALTLQPLRYEMLRLMREPMTIEVAAESLGVSSQTVTYHARKLVNAGLLLVVDHRKKGSSVARVLQAAAEAYVLSDEFSPPADVQAELVRKIYDIAKARAAAAFDTGTANLQVFDDETPAKFFLGQWQLSPDTHKDLIKELDDLVQRYAGSQVFDGEFVRSSIFLSSHIT
jgi:DNA-binding transcriptional ArsR family regulator